MRPQRGSRPRSTTGERTCCAPRARPSSAATLMARSINAGSHVLARPRGTGKPVQPLLVKHRRDAEPRVLDEPSLHGVDEDCLFARGTHVPVGRRPGNLTRARDLADPLAEKRLRLRRIELATRILNLALPV